MRISLAKVIVAVCGAGARRSVFAPSGYLKRRRCACKGVAAIEVLVAVAVVLMVGTVGILSFGGTDRGAVRAEAAATAVFLQETRIRAMEMGRPVEIELNSDDGTLKAVGLTHRFDPSLTVEPDEARVVLQPFGGSDGLSMRFARGSQSSEVTLDWLTGRVTTQ